MAFARLSQPSPLPRAAKLRYANRTKVLACYLCAFALPLLWLLGSLLWIYPYRLANSAPLVAENLRTALPFLAEGIAPLAALAADPEPASAQAWQLALEYRDQQWMRFLLWTLLAAWLCTLLCQLLWRGTHARPLMASRNFRRAVRHYRLSMLAVGLINLAALGFVWLVGVRFIQGRTLWDYLTYFVPYALNGLAAALCSRLAAPPVLSGRHGFFKRL